MPIAVGVFDHMDSGGRPPHEIYEERLKLIEAYDAAGFYGYHVAEHHQTSLGIAPSPSGKKAPSPTFTWSTRPLSPSANVS